MSASEHRVEVHGATLHVETDGDGPPLLFLGGSNQDLRIDRLAFGWARGRRVIAFDWRGLGRTAIDGRAGDDWTMATYARDCVAVLAALGIESCDVVGYSFGAMVAQHLAARFPGLVRRLALIAAGPGGSHGSYPIERFADLPVRERARALLELQDRRVAERWAVDGPDEAAIDALAARLDEKARLSPGDGPARLLAARAGHDAGSSLARIDCPTLVIGARHDGQAPLAILEALAAGIPDAALLVLPGGHGFVADADGPLSHVARAWA